MERRVLAIVLLTLTGIVGACGGDDGGDTKDTPKGGSVAPTTGGKVVCAGETCEVPDGVEGTACCMDPFAGGCGIKAGASCRPAPKAADPRCPAPSFGGMMTMAIPIAGCCADNGECGIDPGTGCMPTSSLCAYIPKSAVSSLTAKTCDGEDVTLPEDCGTSGTFMLPGTGGSSASGGAGGSN